MASRTSVSHGPEPATGEEAKQFGFMDFALEIRKMVYAELLCPEADFEFDEEGINEVPDIAGLYDVAILSVNGQVHSEAREVLLRKNQFVRIFACGVIALSILSRVPVRVVVHSDFPKQNSVVYTFRGAVMSYMLTDEQAICEYGGALRNTCDMLSQARDLDAFVRGVTDPALSSPTMATLTQHWIIIHGPFCPQPRDAAYTSFAAQKRLLQPFREHSHGFTRVKIWGSVDPARATAVLQSVCHEPVPDPDVFLESVKRLKDESNAFFRAGDSLMAAKRWQVALSKMERIRMSHIWPRVRTQLGDDFVDALAELVFTIHGNFAQAAVAQMKRCDPDDVHRLESGSDRVAQSTYLARIASEASESTWQPSVRQQAKTLFRSAVAARLSEDLARAQTPIDDALDLLLGDPESRREAAEIARSAFTTATEVGILPPDLPLFTY